MTFAPDIQRAPGVGPDPGPASGIGLPRPNTPGLKPVFTGRAKLKYDLLILVWLAAALWFWGWWLSPGHNSTGLQYWVATLGLSWLSFLQVFFVVVLRRAMVPAAAAPDPATTRVAMIVTKTSSEPFSVLKITLEAMLKQSYPHDTWLADENPSAETLEWCRIHGVFLSSRQGQVGYHRKEWPRRTRCKEGNLAYFYDVYGYDRYDFVSQMDADHVPNPTYLEEIMRGFSAPCVGYVSAPSICSRNAADSWAARTRLHTEAAFHGIFQAGYSGTMSPMCIGSHYAVRTAALRAVGGLGPELAEDHSTTMILNAGGWRGVHALDAIAEGDGPATISDLCTQEFQWSRSLVTILLRFTPGYLSQLSLRLKFLFLFCQLLYPCFAFFMALFYALPVLAVLFDFRYAEVTYPAFLLHAIPQVLALLAIASLLRADGYFRPFDGAVLSWEKTLFLGLQWPWVLFGCVMAIRDRIFGGFVDFRITPKGEAAQAMLSTLPMRLLLVYGVLALGCLLPVLLVDGLRNAQGFYLLTAINGIYYTAIVAVIVFQHFRKVPFVTKFATGFATSQAVTANLAKISVPSLLICLAGVSLQERGLESLYALSKGLEPFRLIREQYAVAGAGLGGPGRVVLSYDPGWKTAGAGNQKE
ncbi:Cellulose synthase catalytic subunit [UDP-forming] [Phaeobacter sp. CECT 5382]|uniref:glycosyltransferase family 2 protein n=1 Tax=Phaeobacter sp. CECT 5382 TaxID=1712645 RepID=UPI0006D97CC8|nr:glycosyltransferase family 2 protein [Phaeobacter sp. CECT 5382]CUH88074.1 Cellulose synthase catalytic subunit [UDP-forming] [Phaeobacter sp. CECT 5382]